MLRHNLLVSVSGEIGRRTVSAKDSLVLIIPWDVSTSF